VQFDEDGNVTRAYQGKGWDGESVGEGPGDVVRGISGEAVRILKAPGVHGVLPSPQPTLTRLAQTRK
jgi:5-oxoprolinase (ATP-hydrolysing)